MATRDDVIAYFQKKRTLWIYRDGSVENHAAKYQREGLAQEFIRDRPEFDKVCQYAKELSAFQVAPFPQRIEDLIGSIFGFPVNPTMDIILGGIDIACGFKRTGDELIKAGIGVLGVIGLIAILSAIFGQTTKVPRRPQRP